jgi:hypothetical protein
MVSLSKSPEKNPVHKLLSKWPLLRQIATGADGTGVEAMSNKTRGLRAHIYDT